MKVKGAMTREARSCLPGTKLTGVFQRMLSINDLITHAEEPRGKKTP